MNHCATRRNSSDGIFARPSDRRVEYADYAAAGASSFQGGGGSFGGRAVRPDRREPFTRCPARHHPIPEQSTESYRAALRPGRFLAGRDQHGPVRQGEFDA